MPYLVDTNVWLERLLDQNRSEEAGKFLGGVPSRDLFITDFSFHSISLAMIRLAKIEALNLFVREVFGEGEVAIVHLHPTDTGEILAAMREFKLDFDDAYQYVAAEKHGLILVRFDSDFDRTPRGRRTPLDCMQ